ncbi:MAG TPA: ABC transporter substrate-binding protein [Methylomirabilota bacterium]|nr:ABC transporter substrate-binding protein [Methylomirabilota bacterium]
MSRNLPMALAVLLILALVGPAAGAWAQGPTPTGPITIGVLAPSTGPFATYARDIIDGARLYSDEVGGQLGRRKLELVVEDYQTRPDVALTKIRKLVERDRAQAIVGLVLSAAALAVKDYVNAQKVPLLISGFAVAESLTLQQSPYVFRVTYSAAMTGAPIGQWTYRHLKARKAAIIASDSVGPLELMMAWARAFEESGGKIVQEIYPPLGTADMAPWVAKLRQDVDVIGVQTVGADGVRFVKQYQEYGLKGKIPLVDASVGVSEISLLPAAGDAAVGVFNSQPYQYTIDTPRNRKFVQAFRSKFGRDPGSPAAFTYAAMAAIDQAVGATGGNIEDSARFVEALRKTDVEAPQGRVRFDRYQNVVSDIYISRIDKVGDQIVPVVIETIKNVDQFLGLDPADYIKKPRLVTLKGSFAK